MASEKCAEHIHKMRNLMSEICLHKNMHDEKIELQDLDKLKHELDEMWVTCLQCSKGEITGGRDE